MLCIMIKVSAGTASVLGLKKIKMDVSPTTAHLLHGEKCANNCKFCPQARESHSDLELLSRIVWPSYEINKVIESLKEAFDKEELKRACIQATNGKGAFEKSKELLEMISKQTRMPLSVASNINSVEKVKALIEAGAQKVCIAMDAATDKIHCDIKGNNYDQKKKLLKMCAELFPGKISTHFIVGMGESEEAVIKEIDTMYQWGVTVGLFAFTPIKGTEMENVNPPQIGQYRRVQIANYLLKRQYATKENMIFNEGRLIEITLEKEQLLKILKNGTAFETAGCPGCNRPYYNEKPGGVMYNYPRALNNEEVNQAIEEAALLIDL